MSRRRRLLILMIVLAVAIPVGLDSMGKVFAGAGVGLTNPSQPSPDSNPSGGNGNYGLLTAARQFLKHKQIPPTDNSLTSDSKGKRFEEANNNPSGHSDAPWLDGNYPLQLWHSDDFNSLGSPEGSNQPGYSGNSGNGGPSSSPGFGAPNGGGTMLPGGPTGGNGGRGTFNSNTSSSTNPTTGTTGIDTTAPTATPEPSSLLLFATGVLLVLGGRRLGRSGVAESARI